jgi:hypothetical protein
MAGGWHEDFEDECEPIELGGTPWYEVDEETYDDDDNPVFDGDDFQSDLDAELSANRDHIQREIDAAELF